MTNTKTTKTETNETYTIRCSGRYFAGWTAGAAHWTTEADQAWQYSTEDDALWAADTLAQQGHRVATYRQAA